MKYILIFLCLTLCGCDEWVAQQDRRHHDLYSAWCKAAGVTNLTYEEWNLLAGNDMLPGQKPKPDDTAAIITGVAIGHAMSGGK